MLKNRMIREESETAEMTETDELIYSRYLAEHSEDDFRILLERHRESFMLFLMQRTACSTGAGHYGYAGKTRRDLCRLCVRLVPAQP